MNKQGGKPYDLEERTFIFTKSVTQFCRKLPTNLSNGEFSKQVIRSAGSVGANYIEANESLGKKDFLMKIRTCLKEAKETSYWLRLIRETNAAEFHAEATLLSEEATELKKIFSAIVQKSK